MGRVLFWVLLVVVGYAMLTHWARAGAGRREPRRRSEKMVACAACGLNVPQSEALARNGRWYCSSEHLEGAGPAR